jgi:hypothetical protein
MHSIRRYALLVATGLGLATGFAQTGDSSYLDKLPTGDRWIQHLTSDLAPFWTAPAALGNPPSSFPSVRCEDGSLFDYKKPSVQSFQFSFVY